MTTSARKGTMTSHVATCRSPEKNRSFAAPMVARAYTRSRIRVPIVPEATNRSKGATSKTNQPSAMSPNHARQGAAEGADRGADGDELTYPASDEPAAEVPEQRAGGD